VGGGAAQERRLHASQLAQHEAPDASGALVEGPAGRPSKGYQADTPRGQPLSRTTDGASLSQGLIRGGKGGCVRDG